MAWRDNLRPASFRGVEFQIDDADSPIAGRRTARHEYPGQDVPFIEDMGKRTKEYSFDAWVIGDDYQEQGDRLIEACDAAGPGEMVHPYYGSREVMCEACDSSHRTREGRMMRFSLKFVQAGTNQNPTDQANTSAVVADQGRDTGAALIRAFQGSFGL